MGVKPQVLLDLWVRCVAQSWLRRTVVPPDPDPGPGPGDWSLGAVKARGLVANLISQLSGLPASQAILRNCLLGAS